MTAAPGLPNSQFMSKTTNLNYLQSEDTGGSSENGGKAPDVATKAVGIPLNTPRESSGASSPRNDSMDHESQGSNKRVGEKDLKLQKVEEVDGEDDADSHKRGEGHHKRKTE